jgi:hypothetical protein
MEGGSNSTNIYSKSRSDIKIGKLVNKLFPGKYSASELKSLLIHLKAGTENSAENWELVSGSDIINGILVIIIKIWKDNLVVLAWLGRDIFSIYENNPDVCQMLILTEDDKLIGRAIVWKVKSIEKMVALLIVSILWIDNILAKILML